tara:strand:- start:408 stop:977 length:570 start_codon:yes stop_codon:yes gene_type:complete
MGFMGGAMYGAWWEAAVSSKFITLPIASLTANVIFECDIYCESNKFIIGAAVSSGGRYFCYADSASSSTVLSGGDFSEVYVDGVEYLRRDTISAAINDGETHRLRVTKIDMRTVWANLILGGYGSGFLMDGTIRNVLLRTSDEVVVGSWSLDGNTDADCLDLTGSNDGTVSGSPSRAISTDGGVTWAKE